MKTQKILVLSLILMLSLTLAGCGIKEATDKFFNTGKESGIVAVINGEGISEEYFERQYNLISNRYKMAGMEISEEQLLEEAIIPQILLVQESKKEGIKVSKEEVAEFVDGEIAKISGSLSEEELQTELDKLGVTLGELREGNMVAYATQLYIQRLFNKTIWSNIEVIDAEIEEYYNNNEEVFKQAEQLKVSHILVESEEEAEEILESLKGGSDFAETAKENSMCPSSSQGGDLGYFGKGTMVPAFEEAAFDLEIDEMSEIVETQFGYHILLLTDKTEEGAIDFEDVKEQIKAQLLAGKQKSAEETYLEQLKSKAEIDIFLEEETEEIEVEEEEQVLEVEMEELEIEEE